MKKNFILLVFFCLSIVAVSITSTNRETCAAVDTVAPKVEILFPAQDNAVIDPSGFTLSVRAEDDFSGVGTVHLRIYDILRRKFVVNDAPLTYNPDTGSWIRALDANLFSAGYPALLCVQAEDNAGNIGNWEIRKIQAGYDATDSVPEEPSISYIKNRQLIVLKRLSDGSLAELPAYVIKGVTWEPATRAPFMGPHPYNAGQEVQYGYFFHWAYRFPSEITVFKFWKRQELLRYYALDTALMKEMNINTVRLFDFYDNDECAAVLDECYRNGIMAIITVAPGITELLPEEDELSGEVQEAHYLRLVRRYKNHPAVLMWCIGNEWNLNMLYSNNSETTVKHLISNAAQEIKRIDPYHPVCSSLGESDAALNAVGNIVNDSDNLSAIDLWCLNIYRKTGFGTLFEEWKTNVSTEKPFYISEFGTDSFATASYSTPDPGEFPDSVLAKPRSIYAVNCTGKEDRQCQADTDASLWGEIRENLSDRGEGPCLGGVVHSFNDELYKVGNYNISLGGIIDYDDTHPDFGAYNREGFILPSGHPDGVANEEYFGLVDADRYYKPAFFSMQKALWDFSVEQPRPDVPVPAGAPLKVIVTTPSSPVAATVHVSLEGRRTIEKLSGKPTADPQIITNILYGGYAFYDPSSEQWTFGIPGGLIHEDEKILHNRHYTYEIFLVITVKDAAGNVFQKQVDITAASRRK